MGSSWPCLLRDQTNADNEVLLCSCTTGSYTTGAWSVLTDGDQRFSFLDHHGRVVGNGLVAHARGEGRAPPGRLEDRPEQQVLGIGANTAAACQFRVGDDLDRGP